MQVGGSLLDHGEKWAAVVDDFTTLKNIRVMLKDAISEHFKIADAITDAETKAEFILMFQPDINRCEGIIKICETRLKAEYGWEG